MSKPHITVVGAGWAGLSCASALADAGAQITLLEAAPQAGGRARSVRITLAQQTLSVDNGQHLLIGAYRETLALIARSLDRASMAAALDRRPMQFESNTFGLRRKGPGRLGLAIGMLSTRGMNWPQRLALMRAFGSLVVNGWQTKPLETVSQWLARQTQPALVCQGFWEPLCLAAMNTPIEQCCAQTFANVLHDALMRDGTSSDFLVINSNLSDLLVDPTIERLRTSGVTIRLNCRVKSIVAKREHATSTTSLSRSWRITSRDDQRQCDAVVLATPPSVTATLLQASQPDLGPVLDQLQYQSIQTIYLVWPENQVNDLPALSMLDENAVADQYGQWFFARNIQHGLRIAAVVISARGRLAKLDNLVLANGVARQVSEQLGLPMPLDSTAITEKKATFSCVPGRPDIDAAFVGAQPMHRGLALAGDYCYSRYPATLEGAVISGRIAAEKILADLQ